MARKLAHNLGYNPHVHAAQTFITLVEAASEPGRGPEPLCKRPVDHISLDLPRVESSEAARRAVIGKLKELYPLAMEKRRLVVVDRSGLDALAA